ncbi:hypothetical protein CSUI_009969 [Cystoisospora suis]|uniref:Uncharacterized protein n=1 Tax=Cystoisospora suis TaxID=483139 RepID=A0A2C6KF93_9APIC|nr:hypothetical protein CSUI_009969 [Cystoisospora suis]
MVEGAGMKGGVRREEENRGGVLGSSPIDTTMPILASPSVSILSSSSSSPSTASPCRGSPSSFPPPAFNSSSSTSSSSSSSLSHFTSSSRCSGGSSSSSSCPSSSSTSTCSLTSSSSLSPDSFPSCRDFLFSPMCLSSSSSTSASSSSSIALIEELDRDSSFLCKTEPSQQREKEEEKKSRETKKEREKEIVCRKNTIPVALSGEAGLQAEGNKSSTKKIGIKESIEEKEKGLFRDLDDLLGKCRSFIPELKKSNDLLLRERHINSLIEKGKPKKERGEGEKVVKEEEEGRKKKKDKETCSSIELLEAEEDKPYIELELHLGLFDVKGSIPSDEELRAKNVSIVSTGVDLHAYDRALDESREDPVKFFLQQKELERKLKALYKGQTRFGERMIEGNVGDEEIGGVDDLLSSSLIFRGDDQEDEESTESDRTMKKGKHLGRHSPSSSTTGRSSGGRGCLIEILSSGDESTDREDEGEK